MRIVAQDRAVREPVRRSIGTSAGIMSCLEWEHPGAESLLFAHANGFNALTYRTLLAPLSAKLQIVACDLRGHGRSRLSTQPGLVKGWTIFRDDLLALAERISERPVILAGHSLGATASFMAAARAPERVSGLVLLEPVFLAPVSTGKRENSNSLAEMAAQRRSVFPSFAAAADYYRNRGVFARWPDQVLTDYLADGLTGNGDGTLRLACAPDWEAEIFREVPFGIASIADSVNCPITIMRGAVASTAVDEQIAVILRARPDASLITMEGANHFLPLEQPQRSREELLRAAELL
jgi:pimeloyl-ACP methyl ester carboxylesterase